MDLFLAASNNPDIGNIAFVIAFLSIILLICLTFTFWALWRIKSSPKPEDPSKKLTMSYGEQQLLGAPLGGPIPHTRQRLRALRVHLRRQSKSQNYLYLAIGICWTAFPTILLVVFILGIFFPQSWITKKIVTNFYYLGPYVLFPLFAILGSLIVITMIFTARFWVVKDRAPIHVVNLTNNTLKIQLRGTFIGEVHPGAEIDNKKVISIFDSYLVEARDNSGNLRYSKEFDLDELDKIDWNVKIGHDNLEKQIF